VVAVAAVWLIWVAELPSALFAITLILGSIAWTA